MIKIVTVVGARPQFIKAAALSRAVRTLFSDQIEEILLHTGQHYDDNMSKVFFDELEIPTPDYNLNIGSASHARQTALMLQGIEDILLATKPDYLLVYGDTNSTLAGALAASKLNIPVIHIEAGLRSFNKSMPEEINRKACDHISTLLFSPTLTGIRNLAHEGIPTKKTAPFNPDNPGVFHCGDIMFDNLLHYSAIARQRTNILDSLNLTENEFLLCTIHRDSNTDSPTRLGQIMSAVCEIVENYSLKVVIPLHPRTSKILDRVLDTALFSRLLNNKNILLTPPASYFEMITLEKNAMMILTDSGGVQKEAYFFNKPVIVARTETEWVEIIDNGAGIVTDANKTAIVQAFNFFLENKPTLFPPIFGDGHAAEFICKIILENS